MLPSTKQKLIDGTCPHNATATIRTTDDVKNAANEYSNIRIYSASHMHP